MAETDSSTHLVLLKARRTVAANEEVEGHKMPTMKSIPHHEKGRPKNSRKQRFDPHTHTQSIGKRSPRSLETVGERPLDRMYKYILHDIHGGVFTV